MDFRIGAKLGRGPLGASYAAQLTASGTPVVLKVITSRFGEHPALLKQVLGDLGAWSSFRHINAAGPVSLSTYEGRDVALFELAPGKPLDRWLKERGPFDARAAVRVVRDVALALAAAHAQGLACGDVRAAKVYFDGQRAVLADLGQARGSCLAAGLGAVGMHFGHPDALAPEVFPARLEAPTPACDVYALGVLLYELLVGAPPYRGEPKAALRQHIEAPLPPVPVVQASPALARFLGRLVAKAPEERFADGAAVLEALHALVGGAGQAPGAPPASPPSPARPGTPAAGTPAAARPATPAAGTPLAGAPMLTSTIWRNVAQQLEAAAPPPTWTAERIDRAAPVGPDLPSAERTTTMRLPKQLMPSMTADDSGAGSAFGSGTGSGAGSGSGAAKAGEGDDDRKPSAIKLGRKLGQGPVGSSYQGELKDHPQPVAVKVISQRFTKYPELLKRILDAMHRAEGMIDPRVVGVLRVLHVAGRDAAVSELAAGRTLREVLRAKGRLPSREALELLKDLALALQQGRGRELSHGDLRPEKVFVAEGQPARLADFGFAEASGLGANFGQYGVPWGHPDYLAPEVVQEPTRPPDFQTDCYALGILAYEVLTGRPPFVGATPREVLKAHLQAPLPPPPKEAGVAAPLGELLLRLTAKDPRRRPEAPLELLAAIERCKKQVDLAGQALSSPPVEEFDPTSSGEKGEGWMPVQVDRPKTRAAKKPVKTTKALQVPPVAPELGQDLFQSEELPPPR